ncbi:hypothetical protein M0R45_028981 [Rubus argutus]|uniref:Sodium/calcium exchanger membrane region domain-containing protein n=1 Tax=Rubus argutus TaxID=59490 RepID=A0AAW1W947_RUBAR
MDSNQELLLETGNVKGTSSTMEDVQHGMTARQLSSSSLRNKSDFTLLPTGSVQNGKVGKVLINLQVVLLGTKLSVLLPTIPLAFVAVYCGFGKPWVFSTSLLGLTLLAERVSFLTEQVSYYTGPTVGGLLNATFVLSNLLLVLGTSLFCGGLANLRSEQKFERRQANVNSLLLLLAWLSEYVVGTIEDASKSWGLSVSFLSLILVPILGNAAEHAGSIIFALKNKLDISLGVSLGSATQIAMFVVPLCVIVAWIMGIKMDLNFNLIETLSLGLAVITTSVALQDGTSHYVKGLVLILCYHCYRHLLFCI